MHPTNAPIDTYLRVETAEAMDVLLRPAGVFARARSYVVDLLLRLLWLWLSGMVMGLISGGLGASEWMIGLFLLNLFATMWLYPVLFEVFWRGQTPGKRMFKLQVISDSGAQIGWSASLLRNLLRLVDGLPFLYALGMSTMLLHPHGKRIGDILAATLVVYADDARTKVSWAALQSVAAVTPPVALTREEQQALLAFAERQQCLPLARRQELAEWWIRALYGSLPEGQEPLPLVLGMARSVAGAQQAATAEQSG